MDDLATKWVLMTVFFFTGGALLALVWSVFAGQWDRLDEAAMVVLEADDDLDDYGRQQTDATSNPDRHVPVGS